MLAAERRDHLLETLRRDGKIVAKTVAADLGVSEDSIRRDLRELAAEGLCQRVYGGALPVSPALADYSGRQTVAVAGKQLVASAAVRLVSPGSTVILDGGTTALAVARSLPASLSCTVVTHSPTVAAALVEHPTVDVLILGGKLFKHSAVACGAATVEAAQQVSADVFFLGVTGIHPEAGLTTGDADEAAIKRVLAGQAAETYVLGSSEKIGAASPYRVVPLESVAGIITDAPPESGTVERLREHVHVIPAGG
ncbi:DeoR family transcriptional regulator [Xylanimonas oleitrophica]|uniref:Lactose phosphotransferase system repressor n=1 Tax=Xylanimonas oleitrophica TaxID=2607479 RepID=A0A2W5XQG5_9MICO|nr:DeoR/GlpR family DNA-binding transcription regulator [Xylanimonas oleitrophica]PZR51778.1 DeoR family transcriptional regulator [Xylanimonas oleitrophica]